ncbi:hypothetical protein [Streptomyces sp. NPDC057877]|uniref:hypothetical protein n=1 Tax=Streptomyces sp. NPDC057877 TaxID=3346269 RepID=UPI0036CC0E8E
MASQSSNSPSPARPSAPRTWALPIALNLAIGVVAVVPLGFLMFFLSSFPLAALGLTSREPTENDGMLPWAILLVPMWALLLGLWGSVNAWLREGRPVAGRRYWSVGAAVALVPFLTLIALIAVIG